MSGFWSQASVVFVLCFIYLKGTEINRTQSSVHWFTSQMPCKSQDWTRPMPTAQIQALHPGLPNEWQPSPAVSQGMHEQETGARKRAGMQTQAL